MECAHGQLGSKHVKLCCFNLSKFFWFSATHLHRVRALTWSILKVVLQAKNNSYFSLDFKNTWTKQWLTQVLSSDFKKTPVYFSWSFLIYCNCNWSAITNFKILRELGRLTSLRMQCVCTQLNQYAAREFRAFTLLNPCFAYIIKLHLHAEILSWWINDVIFTRSSSIAQFWTWVMADRKIQNLHSK